MQNPYEAPREAVEVPRQLTGERWECRLAQVSWQIPLAGFALTAVAVHAASVWPAREMLLLPVVVASAPASCAVGLLISAFMLTNCDRFVRRHAIFGLIANGALAAVYLVAAAIFLERLASV